MKRRGFNVDIFFRIRLCLSNFYFSLFHRLRLTPVVVHFHVMCIAWHVEQEWKWMISIEREYSNSMKFIDDEINTAKKGVFELIARWVIISSTRVRKIFRLQSTRSRFAPTCVLLCDAMRAIEAVADGRTRPKAKAKANERKVLIDFRSTVETVKLN